MFTDNATASRAHNLQQQNHAEDHQCSSMRTKKDSNTLGMFAEELVTRQGMACVSDLCSSWALSMMKLRPPRNEHPFQ
jgi:hypothetical protein